mmetsp:Transcript_31551/g.74997  ORF Transcript_31551/g.74997 Transcript_31551/m.74997 type:complete len:206 (+) Transcript_31551:264-881(+)
MTRTKSMKLPGRSGMVEASITSIFAPTSASSDTSRRRSKLMLAPLVTATMRWSFTPWRLIHALAPARATAPAGSRIERVSLKTSLMAALMAELSTRTMPSTSCRQRRKVSIPTCFTATPSAKASTLESITRRPVANDCAIALAPTGSTPMTLMDGLSSFSTAAMPAMRPPPPTATNTASSSSRCFTCCTISVPMVPCPAMVKGSS